MFVFRNSINLLILGHFPFSVTKLIHTESFNESRTTRVPDQEGNLDVQVAVPNVLEATWSRMGRGGILSHRIHVWYIYLHLVDFYGKCR